MSTVPFISQLKSLWQAITGDTKAALKTQEEFLDAWKNHPGQQISDLADNIPIVGHVKGLVHLALGDTEAFAHSEEAATRTMAVIGAGALTVGTGGAAAPILAGVAAGIAADAAITGIESVRHQKYEPQGYLGAVQEFKTDWRGGAFDVVALAVGDAVLGSEGSVTKAKYKTTTVFRVEGEGIFLTKRGMVQHGANSRIFSGPGGRVIESPNILKLIVPPEEEEKEVKFKRPAVLCLNIGDASRAETYYAQKLLQYREAAKKLKENVDTGITSRPHATEFQFKIKSFRVLTSDAERMLRDIPKDGSPSPAGVRRVDITKTSKSFECPQPVYTPVIEAAIPGTYEEPQPAWLLHLPTRLLEAMRDHQVAYGRVRTAVIVASKFTKVSLSLNKKITDQEFNRLAHGPVSLSALSQDGIDSIDVRLEPVRRLRQSREVKCGRKVAADIDHGRHMEYLAEFSDGSTSWIPSYNVALDLKREYWTVMTSGSKEIAEIVSSDSSTGKVTVKRPDGTTEVVDQTKIFWQEEKNPTVLTDAELEALLHHGNFGINVDDFLPCTVNVTTDWAKVEVSGTGHVVIMKDPAAEKAGEYIGVDFDPRGRSIRLGKASKFISRDIPIFIAGNGAPFKIKVTHGADAFKRDDRLGRVSLTLPSGSFESLVNKDDINLNPSTFHILPFIATAGLLTVETEWGAIQINSKDATIKRDPTVDQSIYDNVTFTSTSMKLNTGVFDEKFVVPFVFLTRDEKIDLTITHGRDKSKYEDKLGQASALFGQQTYTSKFNPGNIGYNPTAFKDCGVNAWPPHIPL